MLGALLDGTATLANLATRLQLYNKLRYHRSVLTMITSMALGDKEAERLCILKEWLPGAELVKDIQSYIWPTNVIGEAKEALRELVAGEKGLREKDMMDNETGQGPKPEGVVV